jgi:hypothetical protein
MTATSARSKREKLREKEDGDWIVTAMFVILEEEVVWEDGELRWHVLS